MPLAAFHQLAHRDGELATARAAASVGVAMGISSYSNTECSQVVAEGDGKIDFGAQMYIYPNRGLQKSLVKRAEELGFKAIFLTSDAPILGTRWNETRNEFVKRVYAATGGEWPFPNISDAMVDSGMAVEP